MPNTWDALWGLWCEKGTSPHAMTWPCWWGLRVCKDAVTEKHFIPIDHGGISMLEMSNSIPAKNYHHTIIKHNWLLFIPQQKLWWGDQRHLELLWWPRLYKCKALSGYQQHPSGKGTVNMQVTNKEKRQTTPLWCVTLSPGLQAVFKSSALC